MIKVAVLAVLLALAHNLETVLNSDPSTINVVSPSGQAAVLNTYHSANSPDWVGTAAQWLWFSDPTTIAGTLYSIFPAACPQQEATLRITADSGFTAYFNGVLLGTGSSYQKVYVFSLKLKCQNNNLTIFAHNRNKSSNPALIFAIVQDQSKCFSCDKNPLGYYNRETCSCDCLSKCDCQNRLQSWLGYPYCGCKCHVYTINSHVVASEPTASLTPENPSFSPAFAPCQPGTYWEEKTCSCQCKRKICRRGFTQNPDTCKCQCQRIGCPREQPWNQEKCACKSGCQREECPAAKMWVQGSCSCECPLLFVPCANGQDPVTCRCYPSLSVRPPV